MDIQGLKAAFGDRQQVSVVRRHQRTDKVIGAIGHRRQVIFGVVALIEDQGDVFGPLGEIAIAFHQRVGQTAKCRRIGLITRVGVV